jgi:glycosyltransferase involved in cell wall biosynthesis
MSAPGHPRVLLLHNRYRIEGGEERSVALQQRALANAGVTHRLLERQSNRLSRASAAAALLRGGSGEDELADAVHQLGAQVVHAHNLLPTFGPRGLAAAKAAGAGTVLHLHNARLFCAIGVAARDGGPCFRCHHRNTIPGLVLNCRGSLPEAATYAAGLALHQPLALRSTDRFLTPSRWAAAQLAKLGLPPERIQVLEHYLPSEELAPDSRAHQGRYLLAAARLSPEKGLDLAIEAAAQAKVPLWIAGQGPARADLEALAAQTGAPVTFMGAVSREDMAGLLRGAAGLVLSSRYHEFSPYAVLEAMAAGLPVVATNSGGVPELIGAERCVPMKDAGALAERMAELWASPPRRREQGEQLLARARERHSESRFVAELLAIYERLPS